MNSDQRRKVILFVYNFKHKKSVDFIYKLYENNIIIDVILAADYVKIKKPKKLISFTSFQKCDEHPMDVAKKFKIPYFMSDHNNEQVANIVNQYSIDLGIIAGARILTKKIISLFKYGIINFHPALLPECRGLDSMLWSIYNNFPLGVTSHLINEKIDSGNLIIKSQINISSDDNLFSIHKKIYNLQLDLIKPSFSRIFPDNFFSLIEGGIYNTYMKEVMQKEVLKKADDYIKIFSKDNE